MFLFVFEREREGGGGGGGGRKGQRGDRESERERDTGRERDHLLYLYTSGLITFHALRALDWLHHNIVYAVNIEILEVKRYLA